MKRIICTLLVFTLFSLNAYHLGIINNSDQFLEAVISGSQCTSTTLKIKPNEQNGYTTSCCPKEIQVRIDSSTPGTWYTWRRDITQTCNEDDLFVVTHDEGKLIINKQRSVRGYQIIVNNKTGEMLSIRALYQDTSLCAPEKFEHTTTGYQSFTIQQGCCPQTIEVQVLDKDNKNPYGWYRWNRSPVESCAQNDEFEVIQNQDQTLNFKKIRK